MPPRLMLRAAASATPLRHAALPPDCCCRRITRDVMLRHADYAFAAAEVFAAGRYADAYACRMLPPVSAMLAAIFHA